MRRCCGVTSSQKKLDLEATAKRLSDAGMHAEAAQVLSERARLSPKNPMIWNDIGVEYVADGQIEEAHAAFRRALKALADYPPSLYNLGRLAMERCAAEQAKEHPSREMVLKFAAQGIQYLEGSLYSDPRHVQTHTALSVVYGVIGDAIRAKLHMKEASELRPPELKKTKRTWVEHLLLRAFIKPRPQTALPFVFSTGKEMRVRGYDLR